MARGEGLCLCSSNFVHLCIDIELKGINLHQRGACLSNLNLLEHGGSGMEKKGSIRGS